MPDAPDAYFAEPRLAATYDVFEQPRDDLDLYEALATEFHATSVLDVGCGTGELACRLARRGLTVTGVDPADASIAIARTKPGAERVDWVVGVAADATAADVDFVTMTANVAQVFVTDDEWEANLATIAAATAPGGTLAFETRDPAQRAWERWVREHTFQSADLPNGDRAETWIDLDAVEPPLVSFRSTTVFESDGAALVSHSTLRFRERGELDASLDRAGFDVVDVRDAPDRPGREWVYIARRR